jgi:hypothetical protein
VAQEAVLGNQEPLFHLLVRLYSSYYNVPKSKPAADHKNVMKEKHMPKVSQQYDVDVWLSVAESMPLGKLDSVGATKPAVLPSVAVAA